MTTERILAFRNLIYNEPTSSRLYPQRDEAGQSGNPLPVCPFQFCLGCKRVLIPGALFSDGYTDTANFCHACAAAADLYHEEEFSAGLL